MLNVDPLEDQARRLVSAANILAVSTFVPFIDKYAFLKQCDPNDWDFFATAAAIHVAIASLIRSVSPERFKLLYLTITPEIHNWNRQGEDAILDCQRFIKRTLDTQPTGAESVLPTDALGMWIIWNLLRRAPTYEEAQASHSIGRALATSLHDWWDSK